MKRCGWCKGDDLYEAYHDEEWGRPCTDDQKLFEFLILEGAQAGLNWLTILKKREGYRKLFADFNVTKVALFSDKNVEKLLTDPAIVRNRLKVNSAVKNANSFLNVQEDFGSFTHYVWQFVDGKPIDNRFSSLTQVPVTTKESDQLSKDLKKRGFSFVGSTIMYAYMQAMGLVNDHLVSCGCYQDISEKNKFFSL